MGYEKVQLELRMHLFSPAIMMHFEVLSWTPLQSVTLQFEPIKLSHNDHSTLVSIWEELYCSKSGKCDNKAI